MIFLAKPMVTLAQHTEDVVQNAKCLFKHYGQYFTENEKELILLACEVHDLGKLNQHFQTKIRNGAKKEEGELPHALLSLLFINVDELIEAGFLEHEIIALLTAIKYHHIRDYSVSDKKVAAYIKKYLIPNVENYLLKEQRGIIQDSSQLELLNLKDVLFDLSGNRTKKVPLEEWLTYVVVKGILNKCDYNASNVHNLPIEIPHPTEKEKQLPTLVQQVMESFDKNKTFEELLFPSQKFLRDHRGENTVLIAPAGSGKTEGSLLWAGNQKTFYTLPLKVSSTAIYKRVKKTYGFEDAALLHSDALNIHLKDQQTEETSALRRYESMKDLAYPFTVCTVDQLFKFVFKTVGTEMVAATLKYSCVIIDEIQMYSPRIMAFLCYGLKLVHLLGGKFLIMTATMPPMIIDYFEKNKIPFAPGKFIDTKAGLRHCVTTIQDEFNYEQILEESMTKKVLVLCNTIKQAQSVYFHLLSQCQANAISLRLLHSNFTKKHRAQLEHAILEFAGKESAPGNGIWISTQIVEASLDIDFDVLHTEMCPADSLFQRMGRCYRSRTYTGETANVFVYHTSSSYKHFYSDTLYNRTLEELQVYRNRYLNEQEKMQMIERIFDLEELKKDDYYKEFEKALLELENIQPGEFEKREGDYLFREIDSLTIIPDRIFHPNLETLERLAAECSDKALKLEDRLKKYEEFTSYCLNVSLYKNQRQKSVDQFPRFEVSHLKIYRCASLYDSEEDSKGQIISGAGLILQNPNEDFFI